MQFRVIIAAALLSLFVALPVHAQQDPHDAFEHSEERAQLLPEFIADFQPGVEDLLTLTAADEASGAGIKSKIISDLKAMMGKETVDETEDTGTRPDTDLARRRSSFSKQGWKGYSSFVRDANVFMKKLAKQYDMGAGLIIMSGTLTEKSVRYWQGPEGKDSIIVTAKGSFTCRASGTVLCENPFRVYINYGPQDAEGFADVVIRGWLVEFLNDKGRPVKKD